MGKKSKKNGNSDDFKKDNVTWTERWDEVLLDALLDEQLKGNRPNGTWSTTAFNNVLKTLNENFDFPFVKDHVKNRMKTLKNNFFACHEIFNGLTMS